MVHKLQNNAGYFHNKPYKVIFINVHKTIKKKKKKSILGKNNKIQINH